VVEQRGTTWLAAKSAGAAGHNVEVVAVAVCLGDLKR